MIKVFASEMFTHARGPLIRERVLYRMRHADRGSDFEKMSRHVRDMDDETALRALLAAGYDGILFIGVRVGYVVGDVYFQSQNRRTELHLFAWDVHPHHRLHGIGEELIRSFFQHAWSRGFRVVRLSAGGEKSVPLLHVLDKAVQGKIKFSGFRVERGGGEGPGWARLLV